MSLLDICTDFGFFYHPLSDSVTAPVYEEMKAYFQQPQDAKDKDSISASMRSCVESYSAGALSRVGYCGPITTNTKETLSLVHYSSAGSRLNAHTDWGYLTLLVTDSPGLEIQDKRTGRWIDVSPLKNHVLVHVGDYLGGGTHSPAHRVRSVSGVKNLIVFFVEPDSPEYFQHLLSKLK